MALAAQKAAFGAAPAAAARPLLEALYHAVHDMAAGHRVWRDPPETTLVPEAAAREECLKMLLVAWAAVVGGGSVFDPPSFRDLSPEDFQKQWAQNIIADNARRRRRGELAERIMGAEAAPAPPPERAAPAPSAAARALMEAFDGRLGRVTVAMKAEAAQMSAAGRFAVAEHAPQRDGRELLKLRDGAAELVIDEV